MLQSVAFNRFESSEADVRIRVTRGMKKVSQFTRIVCLCVHLCKWCKY